MRILFCAVDSPGIAHQLLSIGRELVASGHEVACAANHGLAKLLEGHAVRHLPPSTATETLKIRDWGSTRSTVLDFTHIRAAIRELRADAVVSSPFGYGAGLAAAAAGVPLIVAAGISFLWSEHHDTLSLARDSLEVGRRLLGMAPLPAPIERSYLGDRLILQGVPALSGPVSLPTVRWVGDCTWDPPDPIDPAFAAWCDANVARGRRIAYAQLGREFGARPLDRILDEVARNTNLAIAIDTGRSDVARAITTEQLFARPYLPRRHAIERAALVLTSGQPTTVLGALAHGRPLVMLPNGSGTEQTSEACEHAGVAVTHPFDSVTADILGALVVGALDRSDLRIASAALGAEIRERGGAAAAARHVLETITPGGTTDRSPADRGTSSRACSPGTSSPASSSPPRA